MMDWLYTPDWHGMFAMDTPLLEIFIRGTAIYLALLCLIRLVLKRQAGTVGITDLLVLMLLADAAQNGMSGSYTSITDGVLLVSVIIFWNFALEWLAFRFEIIERFLHPKPLPLIRNGRMQRKNMKKELITEEELMSHLREEGVEDVKDVFEACLEGDGKISVVKYKDSSKKSR